MIRLIFLFIYISNAILIDIKSRVTQVYMEYTIGTWDHTINHAKHVNLSNQ